MYIGVHYLGELSCLLDALDNFSLPEPKRNINNKHFSLFIEVVFNEGDASL